MATSTDLPGVVERFLRYVKIDTSQTTGSELAGAALRRRQRVSRSVQGF